MSFIGKLIGGSIGFAFAGPLGALAGIALGHSFDNKDRLTVAGNSQNQAQMYFFVAMFSLLAKTAKADGRVSEEEITIIESFMRDNLKMDEQTRDFAIRIFNEAKNNDISFREYALQFDKIAAHKQELKEMMISMLLQLASSDGEFHQQEENIIFETARIFGFNQTQYDNLKAIYIKDTDKYYKILGCKKSDSIDTIKKQYRKLVREYHPDKIVGKGLPEEFQEFAKKKFQEVQDAYEHISEEKGRV